MILNKSPKPYPLTMTLWLDKVNLIMMKRLAILFFIFLIGSNVLTGTPIYAQKSEKMECCKHAPQSHDSAQAAANLCCVINCPQSGATTPTTMSVQFTQFVPLIVSFYRSVFPKQTILPQWSKGIFNAAELFLVSSPPIYLRHSAFLI